MPGAALRVDNGNSPSLAPTVPWFTAKVKHMKSCHAIAWVLCSSFLIAAVQAQENPAPKSPPGVLLQIVLSDGTKIHGSPVELSALPLKIEFAKLDVPLHLIAQGSFTAERAAFAVRFRNGDTLTGTLEMDRVKVQTAYGLASVPVARIATITVTPVAPKP